MNTRLQSDPRARLLEGLPVTERRLELAGVSTAVLEGGSGAPLVLLHGPGEFAAKWMTVIPELTATCRVIAADLPGHGASRVIRGALDEAHVVAWLDELIEHTCQTPPIVVGHLLGGAIAARHAMRRPGRVAQLVLVDSLGLAPFRPAPMFALRLAGFMLRPTEASYRRFLPYCLHDLTGARERLAERWEPFVAYNLECARRPATRKAMRTLIQEVGTPALDRSALARIAVPVSLIWGRHDRANRVRIAEAASERYGWPLQVIDGAADDPVIEQPEAFLRSLPTATAAVS